MSNADIRRRLCGGRHHWETILYSVSTARAWSVARANFVVILFYCQPNSIWSKYYLANTQILFGHLTKRSTSNLWTSIPKENDWHKYIYGKFLASAGTGVKMPLIWDRGGHKQRFSWWNTTMGDILITKLNTAFNFTALWLVTYLGGDK